MKQNNGVGRLFLYVGRYKGALIFSIIFSITYAVGQVGGVLQAGSFFTQTMIGNNLEYVNLANVLMLTGFGFLWAVSHYIAFFASNKLAVSVIHDMRWDVYSKLVDMPIPYYKKNQSGEILSRILNDMSTIEMFLMNIIVDLIAQPITFIAIVVIMIRMNPTISLYFFSIGPVIAAVIGGLGALVQKLSEKVQTNISNITSNIQETLYGIEVIKGYAVEDATKKKFIQTNDNHRVSSIKELRVRLLGTPVSEFLGVVGVIIILVLGAMSLKPGANGAPLATPEVITNFLLLALVLSQPLSKVSNVVMVLQKLKPAANRIFEIVDSTEKENTHLPDIGTIKGDVSFKDVCFDYSKDAKIIKHIDLDAAQGETIAIVGPSGAGKSTLISLIPVFNLATKGKVTIDGVDVSEVNPLSIRRQLSIVTQDTILFSGSIMDNIRLSKPEATDKEVFEAAKVAYAHDFIMAIPEGYNSAVGEKGVKLSGGQKQRIILARAILRKPRILILDEATSSLDAESEKLIGEAMKKILGKQTTFIITHKLATIASADKIVVIGDGKISEIGKHEELISQKGIYNKLFQLQLNI